MGDCGKRLHWNRVGLKSESESESNNYPSVWYSQHMNKQLTFLLSLTFLFLFSGSVYGDDLQDGRDAYKRKDYATAYKLLAPLAEQGIAQAQTNLGVMYSNGQGVPQDYLLAHMWFNLAGSNGDEQGASYRERVERKMSPSQIEKAQELARNWKPTSK